MLAGIAGGVVAGVLAPRFPLGHAAAVLLFLALDTASVLAKELVRLGSISPEAAFSPLAFFSGAGSSRSALALLWCVPRFDRATISTFTSYFFLYPFLRSAGEPMAERSEIRTTP